MQKYINFDIIISELNDKGVLAEGVKTLWRELMENILIVCLDKVLRHDIIRALSKELQFLYADIDEILEYEMLNNQPASIQESSSMLNSLEQSSIDRALGFNKCVLGISRELFVSNDNFAIFKMPKIFIGVSKAFLIARSKNDVNRLEQELLMFDMVDNLVKQNCDIVIEKGVMSPEEICREILSKLKK